MIIIGGVLVTIHLIGLLSTQKDKEQHFNKFIEVSNDSRITRSDRISEQTSGFCEWEEAPIYLKTSHDMTQERIASFITFWISCLFKPYYLLHYKRTFESGF